MGNSGPTNPRPRWPENGEEIKDFAQEIMDPTLPTYVLITPARNEEAFIELTLKSMVAQTLRPLKWVIVSDGSTDRTDEIVQRYTSEHDWIELVRMPERKERNFGGKVLSFNAGRERVKGLKYDIIGNLDADLSFEPDLFAMLMGKFAENPKLGVGGAPFTEGKGTYDFRYSSVEHVSGACQLFRRECFEAIGGYQPMKGGGIDVLAVLTARMNGWQTRTFPERVCFHHRSMGSAKHSAAMISFKLGQKDYMLGRHPLWQLFRAVYQMKRPPLIVGGIALLAGYGSYGLKRVPRLVPEAVVRFQRREQMDRLKRFLFGKFSARRPPAEKYARAS
jgi:poly-beta-1,6-N-acetyl-D-glucosamine synthase